MPTILLLRHGRTTANADGVLAGWTRGVGLDEHGVDQAHAVGDRLRGVPVARVLTSPLQRCIQTSDLLVEAAGLAASPVLDERVGECRYGEWTGRSLSELATDPLWEAVQFSPSSVRFPAGESIRQMQTRAVQAVREHDRLVQDEHGSGSVWLVVSHGDVIKSVLADALGLHLDLFQRIAVDPGSISALRTGARRATVLRMNDTGPDLRWLATDGVTGAPAETVGGGAGPGERSTST